MKPESTHEPEADVMEAAEVWDDAEQIARVLQQNLRKAEPVVRLQIPLSSFLAALDNLSKEELMVLHKRVEERLAP